jgi:hypothetical protein
MSDDQLLFLALRVIVANNWGTSWWWEAARPDPAVLAQYTVAMCNIAVATYYW